MSEGNRACICGHKASQHVLFFGVRQRCRYCECSSFTIKPINAKRIQLVRDFCMMGANDWPDDMSGEKFYHFCMLSGFCVGFFRQDDPPEIEMSYCCSSYEDWLEEPLKDGGSTA